MRPLQLTMQAFGPYRDRTVLDFAELGAQNIFVITGPTGAGKTTIFDAMCYALYGKATGERSEKGLRSDFVQDEDNLITEVIFRFEVRGNVYEIRRQPAQRLPKQRGAGYKDGEHEAELRCINDDPTQDAFAPLSRLNEVEKKIEEILGLSYDQFRKIVMIPQGEFRKFLGASTTEKQEILQKLFGTQLYEKVQNELLSQSKTLEGTYKELQTYLHTRLKQIVVSDNEVLAQQLADTALNSDNAPQILTALAEHNTATAQRIAHAKAEVLKDSAKQQELQHALEEAGRIQEKYNQLQKLKNEQQQLAAKAPQIAEKEAQLKQALAAQPLEVIAQAVQTQADMAAKIEQELRQEDEALAKQTKQLDQLASRVQVAETFTQLQMQITEKQTQRDSLLKQYNDIKTYIKLYNSIVQEEKQVQQQMAQVTAQEETLRQLRRQQILHLGASLAANLEDGAPCPVCGSVHHPAPNHHAGGGVADRAIEAAEQELNNLRQTFQKYDNNLAGYRGQLVQAEGKLKETIPNVTIAPDALTAYAKEITDSGTAIRKELDEMAAQHTIAMTQLGWQQLPDDWQTRLEQIGEQYGQLQLAHAAVQSARQVRAAQLQQAKEQLAQITQEWHTAWQQHFDTEAVYRTARSNIGRISALQQECSAYREQVANNADAIHRYEAELAAQEQVDQTALKTQLAQLAERIAIAVRLEERLQHELTQNTQIYTDVTEMLDSIADIVAQHTMVKRLSELSRGNNQWKMSFETYVLVTYFLQVLEMANQRLLKMTGGRYYFLCHTEAGDKRKAAGLDLDIMDNYTGRARAVSSLSGGEGFKASLALALGLSDTVQHTAGGMELNTILIDEGFGTLDSESLESTIACLVELQQHGRLVGVISHVAELKEQIPAWLTVAATDKGSTARFVIKV